jgi:type I restriction enzyme S subunit
VNDLSADLPLNATRQYPEYPSYKPSGVEWLGDVPADWILRKLKFVASFVGGGTPSKDNSQFWDGEIPWVSPKDMKAEIVDDAEEYITAEGLAKSATRLVNSGSVLIVVRSGILKHLIA